MDYALQMIASGFGFIEAPVSPAGSVMRTAPVMAADSGTTYRPRGGLTPDDRGRGRGRLA